jgi:hypothetical protein
METENDYKHAGNCECETDVIDTDSNGIGVANGTQSRGETVLLLLTIIPAPAVRLHVKH